MERERKRENCNASDKIGERKMTDLGEWMGENGTISYAGHRVAYRKCDQGIEK